MYFRNLTVLLISRKLFYYHIALELSYQNNWLLIVLFLGVFAVMIAYCNILLLGLISSL